MNETKKLPEGELTGEAVVFFCHDGNGKYVMHYRLNCRDENNCWDFGGGEIEKGENVEVAFHRELKEEFDTVALEYKLIGVRNDERMVDGEPVRWRYYDFHVLVDPETVRNVEKTPEGESVFGDLGWFSIDKLPDKLHSAVPDSIEKYRDILV